MSKVLIGRQTLNFIGRQSIESFEENSPEAGQVRTWYDDARKEVLAAHNWTFARRTAALALHTEPATDSWLYRYAKPSNCIAMRKVVVEGSKRGQPYELALVGEEETILTNVESAYGVYTFDVESTSLFSPLFKSALRYLLAHYIAPNLNGEIGIKKSTEYLTTYLAVVKMASAIDANTETDRDEDEPKVLSVR